MSYSTPFGTGTGTTTVVPFVLVAQFALNLIPAGLLRKAKEYYG